MLSRVLLNDEVRFNIYIHGFNVDKHTITIATTITMIINEPHTQIDLQDNFRLA